MHVRLSNVQLIAGGLEADAETVDAQPAPLAGRVRLSNVVLIAGGLEADVAAIVAPPSPQPQPLPVGYNADPRVALQMLLDAAERHNLDPIAVQGHGQVIVDAVNADYPGLRAYAHPVSDAVMWPGFGSVDVTIDSGRGGWSFRPDGQAAYDPNTAPR